MRYLEDELLEEGLVLLSGPAEFGQTLLRALLEVHDDVLTRLQHLQPGLVQLIGVGTGIGIFFW